MSSTPAALRGDRFRPQSIRGRVTVLVTVIAILLLVPAAVAGSMVATAAISDAIWQHTRRQAALTAAEVRGNRLTDPIVPTVAGADLVEVVAPDHHVMAASTAARGRPLLSKVWPTPSLPEQDVQTCLPDHGCLRISALRVSPAAQSPVVYAARLTPDLIPATILNGLFAVQAVLMIAVAALVTWRITGRTLRPVEAIRTHLAAINVNDLSTRVPEPKRDNEISRLAHTINSTLERLERAKEGELRTKAWLERMLDQQRRFTTDASHELRTPLAGLRIQLEEAQLHPDDIDLPHMIKCALGDIDRLQAIIADLLLLAQVGATAPSTLEPVDLAELVTTELAWRSGDQCAVKVDLEHGVMVRVVPPQIGRLLTNLIDNAQRHAEHRVEVGVRGMGEHAELTVTDDGAGIAECDREVVFERFARLDAARSRDRGGTGLGLAIARDIATAHCGTLRIEDPPDKGARFVLTLPLAGQESELPDQLGCPVLPEPPPSPC